MINPMTVMKMLNERRVFVENHPDLYPFLKENLGGDISDGTVIEIAVQKKNGEKKAVRIQTQDSEKRFWKAIGEILK